MIFRQPRPLFYQQNPTCRREAAPFHFLSENILGGSRAARAAGGGQPPFYTASSPRFRSAIRSPASSSPTDSRISPGVMPSRAFCSSGRR